MHKIGAIALPFGITAALLMSAGAAGKYAANKPAAAGWPTTLNVMDDGYPQAGDPCRRLGESAATSNYLDDSATLIGCPNQISAASIAGKVVGQIEGVTLVSVPNGDTMTPGDGDGHRAQRSPAPNTMPLQRSPARAWAVRQPRARQAYRAARTLSPLT